MAVQQEHGQVAGGGAETVARHPAAGARGARTATQGGPLAELRDTMTAEIEAMARHVTSGGGGIDDDTLRLLEAIETERTPTMAVLCAAHATLAEQVAPATPRAVRAMQQGFRTTGWRVFFGPTPAIRRLSGANATFALMFFGLSLTPYINHQTISLSIYDQSGLELLIKLLFILSAAGLGATFGALFDIWQEISEGKFDPISESAHWMRIGLGVIAGLILSELIATDAGLGASAAAATEGERPPLITEPLIALAGGFSAGLLHTVVTRFVSALQSAFAPGGPSVRQLPSSRSLPSRAASRNADAAAPVPPGDQRSAPPPGPGPGGAGG